MCASGWLGESDPDLGVALIRALLGGEGKPSGSIMGPLHAYFLLGVSRHWLHGSVGDNKFGFCHMPVVANDIRHLSWMALAGRKMRPALVVFLL